MSRILLTFLIINILSACVDAHRKLQVGNKFKRTAETNESSEQIHEIGIDELMQSLDDRLNAKIVNSQESNNEHSGKNCGGTKEYINNIDNSPSYCDKTSIFQGQAINANVNPNPRDRKSVSNRRTGRDEDLLKAEISDILDDLDARSRLSKRKKYDNYEDFDELIKEAYERSSADSSVHRNQLGDYDNDDQSQRNMLRLLNLYRLYNKRYQEEESQADSRRSDLGKKLDLMDSGKSRQLDKSRLLADQIAESALLLGYKKGRLLDEVPSSSKTPAEEQAKRDVEVAKSTSAASSTSVDAAVSTGGLAGGLAGGLKTAGAVNVASSTSVASSSSSAVDTGVGLAGGLSVGGATSIAGGIGVRTNVGLGLLGHLGTCEDYERRMIMDMAIEEASSMIRKLMYETRGEMGCRSDPNFERRILGLAIDLVNKVTVGVSGDISNKLDLLGGFRYNTVDDYLKSSLLNANLRADLVSNAGFDYLRHRDLLDGRLFDPDLYEDYLNPYARGSCDSCSKYDLRMGNVCPVCKRSGNTLQSRSKRKSLRRTDTHGKIQHLDQARKIQNKRYKSGGVWEDVNKLYNFNDFENDKFIDMSINCSDPFESTQPYCERLQLKLVTPEDADPVPLHSVRDYLSQGQDLAADMHERARSLQVEEGLRPAIHTPSMLHYMYGRASGTVVALNEESQSMLFAAKVLQEKLLSE